MIQLSECELDMLTTMRRQQDSHSVSRRLTMIIAVMCLMAVGASLWLSVRNSDLVMFLLAMVYVIFSIVSLSAIRTLRHGNPQVVLLLKVVDHLLDETGEVSSESSDSTE